MERTSTKLRKTFRYPTDQDSDVSLPDILDEQEQETFVQKLHEQNRESNLIYSRILLAAPLLSSLPYVSTLFIPQIALFSLLSITLLLSTAYLLFTLPPERTGIAFIDALNTPIIPLSSRQRIRHAYDDGPLRLYMPYFNLVLCSILILLNIVSKKKADTWWGFGWLPVSIHGIVVLAKWIMAGVDPERELSELKYSFKGA